MEYDDLLNSEAGLAVITKALNILNKVRRLQGSQQTIDATGPVVSNSAIAAKVYAAAVNQAGRLQRRCREPEAKPVLVTDALSWGDLAIAPSKAQVLAAFERAEAYRDECLQRHRKF